ncbi:GDYXXLXY domain-containing protein [Massilia sp. CF038]|uniref:GDYXXLXY domain-containing protein n=1 Tax=Massilia sp. CF038 TaxID=1881045 RepID=UPI000916579B|nr:GDYXXLXY domain-containing protein [Massilia sp. CF038]SHH73579.1 Uncharacterized membrane-anchored protein [Massilia sp. CF038]
MNRSHLEHLVARAIGEGILPPDAALPAEEARPWPVVMLTAFGAWLAAIPLIAIFFIAFGGVLDRGAGPFIVGIPILIITIVLLRKRTLPLFVEQMLIPAFAAGTVILAWGLIDNLPLRVAAALFACLACALAVAINRSWLRVLLGVAACVAFMLALMPKHGFQNGFNYWVAIDIALLVWIAARLFGRAAVLDSLANGWGVALLIGLALHAGMTFLLGAQLGSSDDHTWRTMLQPWDSVARTGSVLATVVAASLLAGRWPTLRATWAALAVPVLLGLSWLMPSLGGSLLILAVSISLGNWRLGTAAGVAAAWIVGAFYYQANYPLQTKSAWLLAAGMLLGIIAALALRGQTTAPAATGTGPAVRRSRFGFALCLLAVLAVVNVGIWQKETLIAQGRPIFVELAPVDPRSLMQGDYMRLRFRLPAELNGDTVTENMPRRAHVVARVDTRGIATLQRRDAGTALAPDEMSIELTPFRSGWSIASDGWYFKEGDAARWERARYGEFRVDATGRALLVGMRGPDLAPL